MRRLTSCLLLFHTGYQSRYASWIFLWVLTGALQSGCSIFLGNVKPIDEKSTSYKILDLSTPAVKGQTSEWERVSKTNGDPEVSDIAFQSRKTKSIISLNSSCKNLPSEENARNKDLKELTKELLLGITRIGDPDEKILTVNQAQALQTTLKGRIKGEELQIQTIVLKKKSCIYDLMYIAMQDFFETNEKDFERFITSLKIN